jgi:hypothetical protein
MSTTTAAASSARTRGDDLTDDLVRPEPDDEVGDEAGDGDTLGDIDRVIADTLQHQEEGPDNGDPAPGSLEARLRVLFPSDHTFWRVETAVDLLPEPIQALLKSSGVGLIGEVPEGLRNVKKYTVAHATPQGVWIVKFIRCPQHDDGYQLELDGPDVEISKHGLSEDEVVDLLRLVGAV